MEREIAIPSLDDKTLNGGVNGSIPIICRGCSGQLIPDSILRFSSAATGEMLPLNV